MFEESPMGSTTQESLTHGDESSKVDNGVGSEVVELRFEEVQKAQEKKDGAAEKTFGRCGWLGAHTHRRGDEARSLSPEDAQPRGE